MEVRLIMRSLTALIVALALSVPAPATAVPTPTNPSFAVNTASWMPFAPATITRDPIVFDSPPASGRWARTNGILSSSDAINESFVGGFAAGTEYILTFRILGTVANMGVDAAFGTAADFAKTFALTSGAWQTMAITWRPVVTTGAVVLTLAVYNSKAVMGGLYIDSLQVTAWSRPPRWPTPEVASFEPRRLHSSSG